MIYIVLSFSNGIIHTVTTDNCYTYIALLLFGAHHLLAEQAMVWLYVVLTQGFDYEQQHAMTYYILCGTY